MHQGIKRRVTEKIKASQGHADLVIASRVHGAGEELRFGIDKSSDLLRVGGIIVARGPRFYDKGLGYDKVKSRIAANRWLLTMIDHEYSVQHNPRPTPEPNRLIVAKKIPL